MELLYNEVKNNILINTSYPVNKDIWLPYRVKNTEDLFEKDIDELGIYIHIPFCKNLCKFCEYTRFNNITEKEQDIYLSLLLNQINRFIFNHNIKEIKGFDIGGGTPTLLSDNNFTKLMQIADIINNITSNNNYIQSIEGSFSTWTKEKAKLLKYGGIKRVSMGVQSTNEKILESNDREINPLYKMEEIFNLLKTENINKINLDFMYGMNNQDIESIKSSIQIIDKLKPEHVTIYETRYNMNNIDPNETITKDNVNEQYNMFFKLLKEKGYYADYGMNTFSLNNEDKGLSSYLYNRMFNFTPYKGFGISAQSLSSKGVSYNIGKNYSSFTDSIKDGKIKEEYTYILPKDELVGKYVSISMYSGRFNLDIISKIIEIDAKVEYFKELNFLKENNLITINDSIVQVTEKGFKEYGAITAMFYGQASKEYILTNSKRMSEKEIYK